MEDSLYALKYQFTEPQNVRAALEGKYEGFPFEDDYAIKYTPESIRVDTWGCVRPKTDVPDEEDWNRKPVIVVLHDSSGKGLEETTKVKGYVWSPWMDFEDGEARKDVEMALSDELYEHLIVDDVGIPENEELLNQHMRDDELFTEAVGDQLDDFDIEGHPVVAASLTPNGIRLKAEVELTGDEDFESDVKSLVREYPWTEVSEKNITYDIEETANSETVKEEVVPEQFIVKKELRFDNVPWSPEEFEWCVRNKLRVDTPVMMEEATKPE